MHEAHAVEMIGDEKGEQQAGRRADEEVQEGVAEDLPEQRIPEKPPVVLEADEGRRAQQVPVGEGQPERLEGWPEPDDPVEDDGSRQKRQAQTTCF